MKKRNGKILVQVGALVLALFALAAAVNGIFIYRSNRRNYIDMLERHTGNVLQQTRTVMEAYASLPWLLDYWQTHVSEMELPGDCSQRAEDVTHLLLDRKIDSACAVTPEQAQTFPDREQQLFAEYCYLEIVPQYDELKSNFELQNLYCVSMITMDNALPIFQALPDRELGSYGNFFALGENWPFNASLHPAVSEMYTEREDRTYFEQVTSTTDGTEYLFAYLPIMEDGNIRCHICASYVMDALRESIAQDVQGIERINIAIMVSAAALLLFLINRSILRHLAFVQKTIRKYRETKDSDTVVKDLKTIQTGNEVGRLADDFSEMAVELDRYTGEMVRLTAEKERIDTELSLAARIQADMLPSDFQAFPGRKDFDIYATMDPAKEVGGDFYDFFLVDDDHLCMVMADVSGKGVPAALFMMASKIILANHVMLGKSPTQILTDANAAICANNREDMFVTVWLGILDLKSGKLTAVNAGHEYPAMEQAGKDFSLLKDKHGFPAGALEWSKYHEYEVQLDPGDAVFLYTDGVPEATDSKGELYGRSRMLAVLNRAPDAEPEVLLKTVRADVDAFVGNAEQFDDLTMMCVRYHGPIQKQTDAQA